MTETDGVMEESLKLYNMYADEYRKKICSKCDQKMREKYGCGILKGCSKECCDKMGNAINARKKMKEIKKRFVNVLGKDIDDMRTQAQRNPVVKQAMGAYNG